MPNRHINVYPDFRFKTVFIFSMLLALMSFVGGSYCMAQGYSYVYIQGEKSTPFYVKLEGEMLPRYGKNHMIISRLEPGIIHIEILYQQNAFPPDTFQIKVPENGSRGFLLTKQSNGFALFDLQQGFYLNSGNLPDDDQLPIKGKVYIPVVLNTTSPKKPLTPATKTTSTHRETRTPTTKISKTETPNQAASTATNTPQFIQDIELYQDHTIQPEPQSNTAGQTQQDTDIIPKSESTLPTHTNDESNADYLVTGSTTETSDKVGAEIKISSIPNSDCPDPITTTQFLLIHRKTIVLSSEDARLGYLNSQTNNCFTTAQAAELVSTLDSDAAKYSWLKKIYPHITDQMAFKDLNEVFNDDAWRSHFLQLIK